MKKTKYREGKRKLTQRKELIQKPEGNFKNRLIIASVKELNAVTW